MGEGMEIIVLWSDAWTRFEDGEIGVSHRNMISKSEGSPGSSIHVTNALSLWDFDRTGVFTTSASRDRGYKERTSL